ncbi:Ulp1 protease family protein [Nitzschia inconspicua]|uniref:Ulp1 protease family protein n=1 Tax=Nitzschia inconspicua TaxID=303405 RepID=A0A9K3L032_9STRA|nr:Ulp1 protease family protein [Nitzschia inconspicua]
MHNDKLDKDDNEDTVQSMCGRLQAYTKSAYRYISAAWHEGHFFLVDVTFDIRQPGIFQKVNVCDSLRFTSRQRATAVLGRLQRFLFGFCFHGLDHNLLLLEKQDYNVQQAVFQHCPQQKNTHDCGLFAVDIICLTTRKSIRWSSHKGILSHYVRPTVVPWTLVQPRMVAIENVSSFFPALMPPIPSPTSASIDINESTHLSPSMDGRENHGRLFASILVLDPHRTTDEATGNESSQNKDKELEDGTRPEDSIPDCAYDLFEKKFSKPGASRNNRRE